MPVPQMNGIDVTSAPLTDSMNQLAVFHVDQVHLASVAQSGHDHLATVPAHPHELKPLDGVDGIWHLNLAQKSRRGEVPDVQ